MMEPLTIALSFLFGLVSPVGVVGDRLAADAIRKQLYQVDDLQVRIDNTPSYQVITGRVDKVRVAGRGLYLTPDIRIDTLEMETDEIALAGLQAKLQKPLQGAFRLVLTQDDLNRALRSPQILGALGQDSGTPTPPGSTTAVRRGRYTILNPQMQLLGGDRLKLTAQLMEKGFPDVLNISVETSIRVKAGREVDLADLVVKANDQLAPPFLVDTIAKGVTKQFDLNQLEQQGITARILRLEQVGNQLSIVGFLQLRPQQ